MKKLPLLLCLLCLGICIALSGCSEKHKLMKKVDFVVKVEKGRNPIVLQLTDTQIIDAAQRRTPNRIHETEQRFWATDRVDECCYDYLREVIEETHPDLILITGDIIYGEFDDSGSAMESFVEFMDSFDIPWAPIFGNHDNESKKGVDWQCEQFEKAKNCLFKQRELTGNGNYTVGIVQGNELKRVFFMLDSNGCGGISEESLMNGHTVSSVGFGGDQIMWYRETVAEIKALSPDVKLTFAFHIQPWAFVEVYSKYGFENDNTQTNPINIDLLENKEEGDFGYLGQDVKSAWDGQFLVWNSFKELGVDSILVGHEHCNSASVVYQGIRCQYGQKSSTYDRLNYWQDGKYISASCQDLPPVVGGTVLPLSEADGSIVEPYIYLCNTTDANE